MLTIGVLTVSTFPSSFSAMSLDSGDYCGLVIPPVHCRKVTLLLFHTCFLFIKYKVGRMT